MIFLSGDFGSAMAAIADLIRDHGGELAPETYAELSAFRPSPVDRIVFACEALWGAVDTLPAAGQTLCAQLARMAQDGAFHELGQTTRGALMILGVRRRLGELDETSAPSADDPAPLPQYVPA